MFQADIRCTCKFELNLSLVRYVLEERFPDWEPPDSVCFDITKQVEIAVCDLLACGKEFSLWQVMHCIISEVTEPDEGSVSDMDES